MLDVPVKSITIILLSLFISGHTESVIKGTKTCALLYEGRNFEGEKYLFKDESQVLNFDEEHISSDYVWNRTLSFSVEKGCLLTACNETYLNGFCQNFPEPKLKLPRGLDNILSANCTCQKDCKCSDIKMRSTSCARAYFNPGCNVCNPYYTDLTGSKPFFPEEFAGKIAAIKVRDGCSLKIFDEEDFEGEETDIDGTVEHWVGDIQSYVCECTAESFKPRRKPIRPSTYPKLIDIPTTIEGVSTLLNGELRGHPGLLAAKTSLKNKRSSKNVYILTIGYTGAGKSSAVNMLFDNPNVTVVGASTSTTTDIHEFRIPLPVDELGIRNSELRVIDTPGMGDTRGLEQDAKFLATLEDYLDNHEELHNRIPNVVLIFHKFNDNRFAGEGSTFVKMLRGFDSFRKRITDNNYSNVIFVLSHFCSETATIKNQPKERLSQFKTVIEDYTQFPKPTVIVVAENKASEYNLPMVNGYYKLPNGDFYTRNLFEKIQIATSNGGDPIGNAVITTGFKDADEFNITSITNTLVNANNNKVSKYLDILTKAIFNVENTEISQLLSKSYESMDPKLKRNHIGSLQYLQKALNLHNVKTLADAPKTTYEILLLLSSIKQNEAIKYLLSDVLKIQPPVFQQNVVTGHGYNVFKDIPLPKSPYQLGEVINSDIGYLFPSAMTCNVANQVQDFFQVKENKADYLKERLSSLGIQGHLSEEMFSGAIKPGFNIKDLSFQPDSCKITAVREFRTFGLTLNDKPKLTTEFTKVLLKLPVFNETDHENVKIWNDFFDNYGTHVVKHVHGGGAIEIELQSNKACDLNITQALLGLIQFAEDLTVLTDDSKAALTGGGIHHRLTFKGGNQEFHTTDLTKMALDDSVALMQNWKESLRLNPTILTTEIQLLPMSEVAKKVGQKQNVSSEIHRATSLLFNSSLIYIPPPKPKDKENIMPGAAREETQVVTGSQGAFASLFEAFALQSRESAERFEKLIFQMREDQKAAEAQREKAREEHQKWLRSQEEIRIANAKLEREERERREKEQQARMTKYLEDKKAEEKARQEAEDKRQRELRSMQEAQDKRMKEMMQALANRPAPVIQGGSCLRKGTFILLANGDEKPVEKLQVGDVLLDHELNPTRVLGISSEFLMEQTFYGFDNNSFFFTDSHILAGPVKDTNDRRKGLQLYVNDKERLMLQNPLMEFLHVDEMGSDNFSVYQFDKTNRNLASESVKVFKDPVVHPVETMVYFIQVDSPVGTYFANGYVCRHEIPPLEYWPNTMAVLVSLHSNPDFMYFGKVPYTLTSLPVINEVILDVKSKVEETLNALIVEDLDSKDTKIDLDNDSSELVINSIFNHPSFSVFGMGLYSKVGSILSKYLDICTNTSCMPNKYLGSFQKLMSEEISKQITKSVHEKVTTFTA